MEEGDIYVVWWQASRPEQLKKNDQGEYYFPDIKLSQTNLGMDFEKQGADFMPITHYAKAQKFSLQQGEKGQSCVACAAC